MFRCPIGPRAELRLLEERDADAVFALTDQSRGSLQRWLPWVDATTSVDDTRQFIRASLQDHATGDGAQLGIWSDRQLAGVVGYAIDHRKRSMELGYWLGEAFRGQGLMTRACRAPVTYAFGPLALQQVVIRAAVDNRASRAIAERLEFRLEGIERSSEEPNEQWAEVAVYVLSTTAWRAASDSGPPE